MISAKSSPELWERAKQAACKEAGLCDHSARKMQWAVRYYKKNGGTFKSPKSPTNSLTRWTREKWRTRNRKAVGRETQVPSGRGMERAFKKRCRTNEPREEQRDETRKAVGVSTQGHRRENKTVSRITQKVSSPEECCEGDEHSARKIYQTLPHWFVRETANVLRLQHCVQTIMCSVRQPARVLRLQRCQETRMHSVPLLTYSMRPTPKFESSLPVSYFLGKTIGVLV